MEEELFELKNWKVVTEQKLKLAEQARDEFQKLMKEMKKTLEDKENEVCHAKETAVLEYRDSDALLSELGVSYNDGFDDALRQAKALYPKLDFSSVNISAPEPTSVQPEQSDDTNDLFGEEVPVPIAPEVLVVEGEETRQAKDSVGPDAWKFVYFYFVQVFWEQLCSIRRACRHFLFLLSRLNSLLMHLLFCWYCALDESVCFIYGCSWANHFCRLHSLRICWIVGLE